jgi:hypothetical protein
MVPGHTKARLREDSARVDLCAGGRGGLPNYRRRPSFVRLHHLGGEGEGRGMEGWRLVARVFPHLLPRGGGGERRGLDLNILSYLIILCVMLYVELWCLSSTIMRLA